MSGVRRVIVGTNGSPGSLRALRYAEDLARAHDATVIPVLAWVPPGSDIADAKLSCPYPPIMWVGLMTSRVSELSPPPCQPEISDFGVITAMDAAFKHGLTYGQMVTSREICPTCRLVIWASRGQISDDGQRVIWP